MGGRGLGVGQDGVEGRAGDGSEVGLGVTGLVWCGMRGILFLRVGYMGYLTRIWPSWGPAKNRESVVFAEHTRFWVLGGSGTARFISQNAHFSILARPSEPPK